MTLVTLPAIGTGNGCAAVATGVFRVRPSEILRRGSTSPASEASTTSFWLGTAPAGRLFVGIREQSKTGGVRAYTPPTDPSQRAETSGQHAEATRLLADDRGDDLLRIPDRPFPSFISAATFLDDANTPAEYADFFGERTPNPAVTRVRCPLLAFFGTREPDIGTEADLELLKSCIQRQPSGPRSVETVMIRGADHMYSGEEEQVARTIATWADKLVHPD